MRLAGQHWVGWDVNDDLGWRAMAGEQEPTPAARHPAVGGLRDKRRPWSERCGREPRPNFCGSASRSRWVGRRTTTLVGALWPRTEGELLRLDDPQWVGDERVGLGARPTQISGSEMRRSSPQTRLLNSSRRFEITECAMCKRRTVHTCPLCNTQTQVGASKL